MDLIFKQIKSKYQRLTKVLISQKFKNRYVEITLLK